MRERCDFHAIFLLVVPALVGMALLAAWSLLLGLALFRGEELEVVRGVEP